MCGMKTQKKKIDCSSPKEEIKEPLSIYSKMSTPRLQLSKS